MSDDLRFRYKTRQSEPRISKKGSQKASDSAGIFGIWDEQRRIQEEDERIVKDLSEAKKKTKELQKTLRKNKFNDLSNQTSEAVASLISKTKIFIKKLTFRITKLLKHHKRLTYAGVGVFVLLVSAAILNSFIGSKDVTDTLGDSTAAIVVADDLPREKPAFPILYPGGKTSEDFDVVRISPPEADASFTFLDRFTEDGQIFRVTQQEIPNNFDLAKTATDFQATGIIQVDGNPIYNGYSESGGIQSVLFLKEGKLVSIRSPQRFADDQWANYYISLQ